jgi:hypothetical protein
VNPTDISYYLPGLQPVGWGLAALLGLFWLTILGRPGWWRWAAVWLAILLGAALFAPTIAWVQVPLQGLTGAALVAAFGPASLSANLLIAAIPQVLESGIVQEAAKLLALLLLYFPLRQRGRRLLALGAAVGVAFGAFEAAWVFGVVFSAGWTLATPQLAGPQAYLPFVERFFTVGFHGATGVLLAYGLLRGRPVLMYVAAALLHGLANYGVVLAQVRLLDAIGVEVYVAVFSSLCLALALWLSRPSALTPQP